MSKIRCVPHETGISFTYDGVQYVYTAEGFWHVGEEGVQALDESDVPLLVSELGLVIGSQSSGSGGRSWGSFGWAALFLWGGALFWMGGTARDRPPPYVGICAGLSSKRPWPLGLRTFLVSFGRSRGTGPRATSPKIPLLPP